jgi:opacity protein-like surface antigen
MIHRTIVSAVCLTLLPAAAALAQDAPAAAAPAVKWSDTAELGYVVTSGNSQTSTFGLKNTLAREWDKSRFEFKLGGIRVVTTDKSIFAVGTPTDYDAVDGDPKTTAENYFVNGRFDRKITERFFWFTGAGWDRNIPAGIENRYQVMGGVGDIWIDAERRKWRTDYSATGTHESDVVEPPDFNDTFFGVRVSSNFMQKFGQHDSGTYVNDTIVDENLNDTNDWRVNMTNSVALTMTGHLALKVSLQWLYDNVPAFKNVALYPTETDGLAGTNKISDVPVEAEKLDSIFTTALVIKY